MEKYWIEYSQNGENHGDWFKASSLIEAINIVTAAGGLVFCAYTEAYSWKFYH